MDLENCLKNILKNKFQKVKEAENSLLPSRLCYRELKQEHKLFHTNLLQNEFRFIDKSDLHTWVVYPTVPLSEILSCDCKHNSSQRTVLTVGVCGVGKTTTVQRCALEWAEGKACQDVHLLFPLTFWELNLLEHELTLIELLLTFFPDLKELDSVSLRNSSVCFVLDALDEYHGTLDFHCPTVSDVSELSTVENLLTNLIRGDLLPLAHIWITTRFAAATQIPDRFLLKETEVQGFNDEQQEEHLRALVGDDNLADKVINHVKISRSLDFLCQVPTICTIMANVLKDHLKPDDGFKIHPLSLTQIYTNLLKASNPETVAKLKMLAKLWMGECEVFYDYHLSEIDLSVEEASTFSKECPLVLKEENGLHNSTVFRFGHSSILEFFAASAELDNIETKSDPSRLCKCLVDTALESSMGKTDVFLRFIFGLLRERGMLEPHDPLLVYTKKLILDYILSYKAVGLFHCLREYDNQALLHEVKFFLKYRFCPISNFSEMHWTIMLQRTSNFEGIRDSFEMPVSARCDEKLIRQLAAIFKSKKAMLRFSNLTDKCCPALASILSTKESYLRELDLGFNSIRDEGVRELVEGLSDENCRLKTIRLQGCGLTGHSCEDLALVLRRSPKLRELDLSMNEIGDDGVRYLADGLRSPECQLETLRLSQCNIEEKGSSYLASALQENWGSLKVLDLSINMVGDKGTKELYIKCDRQLTKLEIYHCGLTVLSCHNIGEALKYETSSLVELNLSNNQLKDAGFALICEGMYAWCRLEKLNVSRCGITGRACVHLATVLCSLSQLYKGLTQKTDWKAVELRELDLSMNCLGDQGVREISAGLKNPCSRLRALNLSHCSLTDDCCAELASGLASKESILSELDLSENNLQDKGVRKLCTGIRSPHCKLEKLSLRTCGLTSRSIQFLSAALKANPQHLAELHLMGNNLENSGLKVLVELTKNQKYCLHTIDVCAD
ncbi:NACHT, LRR and PYD domains-containing protein 14-like isoform X2 [Gymnodraco acuticeps]|uniref:NACHT, LRR and PYD domains-containing protein 14-like isoform X2 n=1 Tax=Gymnodraco acuticeps TaxID=8218 RepID=A0A6P8UXA6_GYMAC|nr:NACHT, LRR and PYD domains-containing protein 14-like isoform X2 [Gymnodraco acuticeps]